MMNKRFAIQQINIVRPLVPAILVALMVGCSGGSSGPDGTGITEPPVTAPLPNPDTNIPPEVTPPVVVVPDDPEDPVDEEDEIPPPSLIFDPYDRPYDYPDIATLPLQYFPT